MEGTAVERVIPDAQFHLKEKVVLCQAIFIDRLTDHLQRVIAVFVDARLPATQVEVTCGIWCQCGEKGVDLDRREANIVRNHCFVELRARQRFFDEATNRAAESIEGQFRGKFVLEHPLTDATDNDSLELTTRWLFAAEGFFESLERDLVISILRE